MSAKRIKSIVSTFIRSEYFAQWQAEEIESGSYSSHSDRRERFSRCYEAATDGCDGSTHAEHIHDMREAFKAWLHFGRERNRRLPFAEPLYRLETAVDAHFDALEAWHEQNGSLHQEVG